MASNTCYHCGGNASGKAVTHDDKTFCCQGCTTVYDLLKDNGLTYYYQLEPGAGARMSPSPESYDFLDNPSVVSKLLEFDDNGFQMALFYIPHIHCSSCIWILENLNRLHSGISHSQVAFGAKKVRIGFNSEKISLKEVVRLLASLGYAPHISLNDLEPGKKKTERSLLFKLGVAGFAFGNVMFLSFPEYSEVLSGNGKGEFWLAEYTPLFRWLMFAFSLPVLLYASTDYLAGAFRGLKKGLLNIDVPIALGIIALFGRSTYDIAFQVGPGYFDSFTGLVFFLLLGRFFQQKTYHFLSFERDYKSYFPIAVTRLDAQGREENIPIYDVLQGDHLLIHNGELIPADGIMTSSSGEVDYSFVTGESEPVLREKGNRLFAGGRHLGGGLEMQVTKPVSQSYLTQLWGHDVFSKDKAEGFRRITDRIGPRFTVSILSIAGLAALYWFFKDPSQAIGVFTSVLIIACPCALALAAPFTLGNLLRILGRKKFYLRSTDVLEQMATIDSVVFDKTGTLTTSSSCEIRYEGDPLSEAEESLLRNTLRASNHPLSRKLYEMLAPYDIIPPIEFHEETGKGITGRGKKGTIQAGSATFTAAPQQHNMDSTQVHIRANNSYRGRYIFETRYRDGIDRVFASLGKSRILQILSGDNEGERSRLAALLPAGTPLHFNQDPEDKLHHIATLQRAGRKVMMIGDGLNDAGALAQSDVGIAVSENVNVFSPACDGILDASKFQYLPDYMEASRKAMHIIHISFGLSLLYNITGLYFAVTGQLQPVIAAILMPLSSITIVGFTTLATTFMTRKLR